MTREEYVVWKRRHTMFGVFMVFMTLWAAMYVAAFWVP